MFTKVLDFTHDSIFHELSPEDYGEIERQGFTIKNYLSYKWLFLSILLHYGIIAIVFLIGFIFGISQLIPFYVPIVLMSIVILYLSYRYVTFSKGFFTRDGIIINNNMYPEIITIPLWGMSLVSKVNAESLKWGESFLKFPQMNNGIRDGIGDILLFFFCWILFGGLILISIFSFIITFPVTFFFKHTLRFSRFILLVEKLSRMSPCVEEKSEEIQSNFENDMNFQALSEGFDSLSSTFSQIVTLVIKLEHIEKKANKGNLFDSEKYINSLRNDILTPLKSLKSFLEKQREELMNSQKELEKLRIKVGGSLDSGIKPEGQSGGGQRVRVRVGGADLSLRSRGQTAIGGQEQAELSSKITEPLLVELTENIAKLDEMIEKMG